MLDHHIDGSHLCSKRFAKLRFRQDILSSWGECCAYCGAPAGTLDHVRARRRGGPTTRRNLVAACAPCNRAKGSEDWRAWFRAQCFWDAQREDAIYEWIEDTGGLAA